MEQVINIELKKKWIEALRSGKYKQTKGRLHDDNGFCCYGVLCDIISPNEWVKCNTGCGDTFYRFQGANSMMPDNDILKQVMKTHKCPACLAAMNDRGRSFNEIADVLQKELDNE